MAYKQFLQSGHLLAPLARIGFNAFCFATAFDTSSNPSKNFSVTSFFFSCVNGSFVVVVSKIAPEFSISLRMMFVYIGTALTLAIILGLMKSYQIKLSKGVLLSIIGLTTFGLGCCGLMFVGSNYLAGANMASIAIPILQGTAIGGFALYSTFVLKEKCSLLKWGGIILIILGIVFMV